jgi:hypothetical protein
MVCTLVRSHNNVTEVKHLVIDRVGVKVQKYYRFYGLIFVVHNRLRSSKYHIAMFTNCV